MKSRKVDVQLEAIRIVVTRVNAAESEPRPICIDCEFPILEADEDWLDPSRCASCVARRIDRQLWKIARRIGRRRLRKLLKALSK
jgi:hypothetical protein